MNFSRVTFEEKGRDGALYYLLGMLGLCSPKSKLLNFNSLIICMFSLAMCWLIYSVMAGNQQQSPFTLEVAENINSDIEELNLSSSLDKASFTTLNGNFINLGKRDSVWLKLTKSSTNVKSEVEQAQILVVKKNRIYTPAQLHYLTASGKWTKEVVHGSPQFHQNIVIRLPENMADNTLYVKLHGRYLRASLYLFDDGEFFEDLQLSTLYSGLFFGMLLLFSLYHIMLYIRLKSPSYLAYSVVLLLLGVWFLSGQGWLAYFLPNIPFVNNMTVLIGGLLVISIGEFAKHYLQIKVISPRIYKALLFAQLFLLLLFVARLCLHNLLPSTFNQFAYGLGLIICFVIFIACFSAAIIAVKKQKTAAGYYLTATIMFFVMASLMGLSAGNIIDLHFSWPLLQMASAIEIIIFSAGLVSMYYQQQQNEMAIEIELQQAQQKLVKQLEISNALKDKVLNHVVEHKLFPELAKITPFLPDIIYVQALGNESLVVYKKHQRKIKIELACNLQNLIESFGGEYLIRVHKSYLVNPLQPMSLQRRTSADYDLQIGKNTVPVGRKYLNEVKKLV